MSSLVEILRNTLKGFENDPEFVRGDRPAQELRRRLLVAIADLEEKSPEETQKRCA